MRNWSEVKYKVVVIEPTYINISTNSLEYINDVFVCRAPESFLGEWRCTVTFLPFFF